MKFAVTGHRPDKLGGYQNNTCHVAIKKHMRMLWTKFAATDTDKTNEAISGMALGCDQWWAEIGMEAGAQLLAYIPFPGFDGRWPQSSRDHLAKILLMASEVIMVDSNTTYSAVKLQKRNERMVDDCDTLVAYWTGVPGGTANCIKYARATYPDKPILIINPLKL